MQKRTFIKGGLGLGLGSLAGSPKLMGAGKIGAPLDKVDDGTGLLSNPLINRAQALSVMEEYDLAGMIALNPLNVFYLTNTRSIGVPMQFEYPSFATIARNKDLQTFLITLSPQMWDIARDVHWSPDVIYYSGVRNSRDYMGPNAKPLSIEPEAYAGRRFAVRDGVDLTPRERAWKDTQTNLQPEPSPEWAIAKALKESGIVKGRVAVDDMRIARLLNRINANKDIEFVDGDNYFRHIRVIKSPVEVELMRITARRNAEAALATARSIERGMTFGDIQQTFLVEAAARGNKATFLIAGTSPLGDFPNDVVEPGVPFLMDAVSEFHGYHGDYARALVLGEPSKEYLDRVKAQCVAREAALEVVRPGTMYSKIRQVAMTAYEKAGGTPGTLSVTPHSVGLQHTDQPLDISNPWRGGIDIEMKKGMTITIDFPCIEIGFGSGSNEDLLLVTDDGYELLNSPDNPLIIL